MSKSIGVEKPWSLTWLCVNLTSSSFLKGFRITHDDWRVKEWPWWRRSLEEHVQQRMRSQFTVIGCSAPFWNQNLVLEPVRRAWRLDRESLPWLWRCACLKKALFGQRFGSYLAVGELQPVGQLSQGTIHVWIDISVESPWNPANGRLFCYMNIQEWVRVKLLLSLWCYRNNSFGFYILKKASCL